MNSYRMTAVVGCCLLCGAATLVEAVQEPFEGIGEVASQPVRTPRGPAATLASARDDLRISRLTVERITRQIDELRTQPEVDLAVLEDYLVYLEKVRAMMVAPKKAPKEIIISHRPPAEACLMPGLSCSKLKKK